MKTSTLIYAALLSALSTPALADGFRWVGGEAGWAYVGSSRQDTAQSEIQRKREHADRNVVTADGWKQVDGEAGWLYLGPQAPNSLEQIARARIGSERNKVNADGWKLVDGEAGWLYVGPQIEMRSIMEASSAIR